LKSIRKLRQRVKKKATDITYDVKVSVAIRDNGLCVNCKNKRGIGQPNAHFIARQFGGLRIEENILELCDVCHKEFDNATGKKKVELEQKYENYLKSKYSYWNRKMLVLRSWKTKKCKLCNKEFGTRSDKQDICKMCENSLKQKQLACSTKISSEI